MFSVVNLYDKGRVYAAGFASESEAIAWAIADDRNSMVIDSEGCPVWELAE